MAHEPLDPSERRTLLDALDRLEERLETAPTGLHAVGAPASAQDVEAAGLPEGAALLWTKYDGVELMSGEARVFAAAEIPAATAEAADDGLLREGDIVVGERGRLLFALPDDPWAEGASVVCIDEEADRVPEATSVIHLLLGVLGETSVLYDEHGEFRDALVDEWGDLEVVAHRKLLRRRLDFDPIAPGPRLRLARLLHGAGELRGAAKELDKVLHYAPEFGAALHERGLVLRAQGKLDPARRSFVKAAEHALDPVNAADALAWAARVALEGGDEPHARAHAQAVLSRRPDYAKHQLVGAQARHGRRDDAAAREMVALGLAVAPRNVELLQLRRDLEETAE